MSIGVPHTIFIEEKNREFLEIECIGFFHFQLFPTTDHFCVRMLHGMKMQRILQVLI